MYLNLKNTSIIYVSQLFTSIAYISLFSKMDKRQFMKHKYLSTTIIKYYFMIIKYYSIIQAEFLLVKNTEYWFTGSYMTN